MLCVPRLLSSVHDMDCLGEETVPVSGRSGAQSSGAYHAVSQTAFIQ